MNGIYKMNKNDVWERMAWYARVCSHCLSYYWKK